MKSILSLLVLIVSQMTFAQDNSCVSRASDQELLREISYRMRVTSPVNDSQDISISSICGPNAVVQIDSIKLSNGQATQLKIETGSWTTCKEIAQLLNEKLSSKVQVGKVFAVCVSNAVIKKYTITSGGVVQSSSSATGSWTVCNNTAQQINSKL